ncbi:hypothetical protein Sango_3092200 [Sesamum angolense]|uniref:Reverse transcriptase zinc-binding domain-containing protein n=1 Tax=Sesamum angolense TaxID=2727404 RepID=A0AAE1VZ57_9LAMI|nr:hypothetical protein Sango_3092200 [Sesamum angolense]
MDKPWLQHLDGQCVLCSDGSLETHDHLLFTCSYSRLCIAATRRHIRFHWPYMEWQRGIQWATSHWRGKHVVNGAYRSLLASLVYHIWQERNIQRFQHKTRTPSIVAAIVVRKSNRGSLVHLYAPLLVLGAYIDYGISLGLSREMLTDTTCLYCTFDTKSALYAALTTWLPLHRDEVHVTPRCHSMVQAPSICISQGLSKVDNLSKIASHKIKEFRGILKGSKSSEDQPTSGPEGRNKSYATLVVKAPR